MDGVSNRKEPRYRRVADGQWDCEQSIASVFGMGSFGSSRRNFNSGRTEKNSGRNSWGLRRFSGGPSVKIGVVDEGYLVWFTAQKVNF